MAAQTQTRPPFNDLHLYTWDTPNGAKPVIVIEELSLPCTYKPMDMFSPELKSSWYTSINPNSKIPALIDGPLKLFESGAIMLFLVDTYDPENKISFEKGTVEYWDMVAWLFMQVAGLGPMQGQANWFMTMAPVYSSYARERYVNETKRYFSVVETRLQHRQWLVGDKFSIADISWYTWMRTAPGILGLDISEYRKVVDWIGRISQRQAVKKAKGIPETGRREEEVMEMFGRMREVVKGHKNSDDS